MVKLANSMSLGDVLNWIFSIFNWTKKLKILEAKIAIKFKVYRSAKCT